MSEIRYGPETPDATYTDHRYDEHIFETGEIELGHEATDAVQHGDTVTTEVKDHTTDTTKPIRSKYVIGCDGGRSTIRKVVSEGFNDWAFGENHSWVVADTRVSDLEGVPDPVGFDEKRQNDRPPLWQYSNPERPFSIIPVASDHIRVEFALTGDETEDDFEDDERIHEVISEYLGDFGFDIFRSAVYDHNSIVADNWRDGRILIAGDAAHQMPPYAGRGMAEGIRDAQNLTWKLNLVLSGLAPSSLLDSYQQERMPITEDAVKLSMRLGSVVDLQDHTKATARDLVFRFLNTIPPIHETLHDLVPPETSLQTGIHSRTYVGESRETTARGPLRRLPSGIQESLPSSLRTGETAAKDRLPQPTVRTKSGETCLLDEVVEPGRFGVIGWECDPQVMLDTLDSEYFDQLPTQFVMVTSVESNLERALDTGTVIAYETTEKLQDWFADHHGNVAIVRPDRYVYGIASTTDVPALVDELRQQVPVIGDELIEQERLAETTVKAVLPDGGNNRQL
jgi:3-(3-hydroxy-phenyl)propionate hydroxylase